jgi:hypothetical protein
VVHISKKTFILDLMQDSGLGSLDLGRVSMASVKIQVRMSASHGFDYEHPRLLGFPTFGLYRRILLGIVEG